MDVQAKDSKYLIREYEPRQLQVARTEGSYVYDSNGRRYIDFTMGWCVGNFGWSNEEIETTVRKFSGPTYVGPDFLYKEWSELGQMLAELTPGDLSKCVRTVGGTESVEAALQIARAYKSRRKFIAIKNSYHGNSIAVTAVAERGQIPLPLDEKALAKVERLLKSREYAGLVMEPVICNLGAYVPPTEFMVGVRDLCTRYGTLLIFDEVACGWGRTGKLFATEHFPIVPDILTMSKAMGGGYAPIGATITTLNTAKVVENKFDMYSTFGWHPKGVAAALAVIEFLKKNGRQIFANVSTLSDLFNERLSSIEFKSEASIRIKGFAIGLQFSDEDYADKLANKCEENGLLLTTQGDTILIWPALTADRHTVEEALDIIEDAAKYVRRRARRREARSA